MKNDSDGLIDEILSKARAADAAEVFYESSEEWPVEFENNRLKTLATKSSRGVGLRVINNGRIGYSSTSDLGRLDELVENALVSAGFGEKARFELPAACDAEAVKTVDDRVSAFTAREMTDLGREAIARVLERHPEVQCSVQVSAEAGYERIANSRGLDVAHASTTFSVSITALAVGDDGFLWVGDAQTGCRLLTDTMPLTDKIVRDLDLAGTTAVIPSGTHPAIFTPDAMATLLISLSDGVDGKLVQKGASPLGDRLGERIFDERVSVFDDGLIDYAASSAPHDTEGIPSRRTALVDKGVLTNFIFDLQTAGMMNTKPTGNGLRDYGSQPGPGHNNTVVVPGDTSFEDMLGGIRRGLLVDGVLGGGGSNTLAGEFSVNLELGFLIEDGRLAGRVKNCMLFGNIYDLMRDGVAAVGDTPEMKGSLSMPCFCFKGLSVGAR